MSWQELENQEDKIIPITEWPVVSSDPIEENTKLTTLRNKVLDGTTDYFQSKLPPLKRRLDVCGTVESAVKCQKQSQWSSEPFAAVRIAKWWRSHKHMTTDLETTSKNPNTQLFHISRTSECQQFLRDEKYALEKRRSKSDHETTAAVYAAIASIDDWLGLHESALENITAAVKICGTDPEYLWLKEKIQRQCQMLDIQRERNPEGVKNTAGYPPCEKVDRVSARQLSVQDFQNNYVKQHKPVIIEDVVSTMTGVEWNLKHIKDIAGSLSAPIKNHVSGSVEWAKLEEGQQVSIAEFIDKIETKCTSGYLFDWSLPLHCPELASEITIPKYFKDNFLTLTDPGSLYRESWPSLFVAPPGVTSDLHVDAFGSSFWMALFQGEKRWTFFDPKEVPLLYPRYLQSLDAVFSVDLAHPDLETFPLLAMSKPKQCILKPGDLLFVPAGSPHYVENLSASVAVSSNYVDASNYRQVCEELRISGLLDPRAAQLLAQLQSSKFTQRLKTDIEASTVQKEMFDS